MINNQLLGPWIRRFLMEHLVDERNLTRATQANYRDALALLMPFSAKKTGREIDRLSVEQLSPELVRQFLLHLEKDRGSSISTRNQRLAAIHSLAKFIGTRSPELLAWCGEVRAIPFKKAPRPMVAYLEKDELDALLAAPDIRTPLGRRDHAILLFLYNTGARADEAARATIADLARGSSPSIKIVGKGGKTRHCPLWDSTLGALKPLLLDRPAGEPLFLNRQGEQITRFGIFELVKRYAASAGSRMAGLRSKRVSPHTIRHTTAVHLLRAGVDINTIRAWLGHVSLDTTHIYAEVDVEMKAQALARCEIASATTRRKHWNSDRSLMAFLRSL